MAKKYLMQGMLAAGWLVSAGIVNALEVIYTGTHTVDAKPYYEHIQIDTAPTQPNATLAQQLMTPDPKQKSAEILENLKQFSKTQQIYPFTHATLSLGSVSRRTLPQALPDTSAMFVIGGDKTSLTWMKDRAAHLQQIHAVGYLVSAESHEQYQRIQAYAKTLGLNVLAYQGVFIFQQLKIEHYPVIVYRDQIYQ